MTEYKLTRRFFLQSAVTAGAVAMADASLRSIAQARQPFVAPHLPSAEARHGLQEASRFAPVKVARDRIIRTVVGLRPYRKEGFVVEGERLGNKLLVHNYGHGGAGVTLSWGTSSLAVDIAREYLARTTTRRRAGPQHFAVLGCGVMGLSTARLIQRRLLGAGGTVTIYAKEIPPQTTSNIAGALWYPASFYNQENASAKFLEQFPQACLISNRAFQELVGDEYGVRWTDTYELINHEASLEHELPGGVHMYPQTQIHRDSKRFFGFPFTRQFSTMMIEPHTYMRALVRDFYTAGGRIVVKEFRGREEIARLSQRVVFNCTGLGAGALFDDQKLRPVRGQLEVLLPQPEVDYCYLSGSSYMFPRRDGIILGGTFDRDDWSLEPNPAQTTQILEGHADFMKKL